MCVFFLLLEATIFFDLKFELCSKSSYQQRVTKQIPEIRTVCCVLPPGDTKRCIVTNICKGLGRANTRQNKTSGWNIFS